ncbi:MAG: hypothetical protein ABI467_22145 [Kofleriaceae bacterium]
MTFARRSILKSTLFGAGLLGLRSLATGIPVSFLAKGPRAFADDAMTCVDPTKAQFVILATSGLGDPLNANAPGTYGAGPLATIAHNQDPTMKATALTLGGAATTAALPWATPAAGGQLPQYVLDRMAVWHLMTNTPVHPKEPDVLSLMDTTAPKEMLPSLLGKQLGPCLGTIQNQPITLGATSPSEGLSFSGQALPIIPPLALKATLANPAGTLAGITSLQKLRDDTLSQINDIYRRTATRAQKSYLDAVITSQSQIRSIDQDLLNALGSITDNSVASQITAAIVLIQMNVTPVVTIHIPFGGDNHTDTALANEAAQTTSGLAAIAMLMSQLHTMSNARGALIDQVTFASLNVFGRTIGPGNTDGRQHNPNHQVSLTIGKPFKSGILGGIAPVGNDFGATAIGSIVPTDTLASFGKTVMKAAGVADAFVDKAITSGTVVDKALA